MPQRRLHTGNSSRPPAVTDSALSLDVDASLLDHGRTWPSRRPRSRCSPPVAAAWRRSGRRQHRLLDHDHDVDDAELGLGDKAFGGAPGGGNAQFQIAMNVGNATLGAKFSACMRKHGVTNFPDPNSQGVIQFGSELGIDPNSPTFQSAQNACQKLLPNGGQPTPQQQAQMQQQLLAFSKCMRAHGIKDFPDPSNGGLKLHAGPGSDLNPDNPQFQAAQQACQGNLPFKARRGWRVSR